MKLVSLLAVIFLGSPAFVWAAAGSCHGTHTEAIANKRSSLQLRTNLQSFFEKALKNVRTTQAGQLKKLMQEFSQRTAQEKQVLQQVPKTIGGIPLDFKDLPPSPVVSKETWDLLEKAYGETSKSLDKNVVQELRMTAYDVVSKDPYFEWLQEHQVPDHLSVPGSSDPVGYLIDLLETPGPMALSPKLAFLQVYHDADPMLTPLQSRMIQDVLQLEKVGKALETDLENLRSGHGSAGPLDANGLAPSLEQARQNLHEILSRQPGLYGARFSKTAYERALIGLQEKTPAFKVLSDVKRYMDPKEWPAEIRLRLNILKFTLGLPSNFPEGDLPRMMEILARSDKDPMVSSYELFLLQAFGDPNQNPAFVQVLNLKTLIEFTEATVDSESYQELLKDHIRRLYQQRR